MYHDFEHQQSVDGRDNGGYGYGGDGLPPSFSWPLFVSLDLMA